MATRLGPLVFLIFLNGLPEIIKNRTSDEASEDGKIVIFVDDNTPTLSDKDPISLLDRMKEACVNISD